EEEEVLSLPGCLGVSTPSTYFTALLKNLRSAFALSRLAFACTIASMIIKLIANYDIQKWIVYVFWGIFIYESVFRSFFWS
ncbi:MAG: hypothetical protein IIX06_08155, partial [Bacteroidales bacterium]|nr:hypothetical protein [Bacteroidales bacterium]